MVLRRWGVFGVELQTRANDEYPCQATGTVATRAGEHSLSEHSLRSNNFKRYAMNLLLLAKFFRIPRQNERIFQIFCRSVQQFLPDAGDTNVTTDHLPGEVVTGDRGVSITEDPGIEDRSDPLQIRETVDEFQYFTRAAGCNQWNVPIRFETGSGVWVDPLATSGVQVATGRSNGDRTNKGWAEAAVSLGMWTFPNSLHRSFSPMTSFTEASLGHLDATRDTTHRPLESRT